MTTRMRNFIKARYNWLFFTLLTFLLLLSCFFSWAVWLVLGFSCLFGCFLSTTSIISNLLYTYAFNVVFEFALRNTWVYMFTWFVVLLGLRYLFTLYKNAKGTNEKYWFKFLFPLINWKLLLPMMVLLFYLILPIHNSTLKSTLYMGVFLAFLYLVFENRKNIDVCTLVKMFSLGVVISGLMSLLRPISTRLDEIMAYGVTSGCVRFSGLTISPNLYAMYAMLGISALLILKYINKIDNLSFWSLFIPLFAFGFCTISRNFMIAFVVEFILFGILYVLKYKKSALKFGGVMLLVLVAILGICFTGTKIILVRLNILPETTISKFIEESNAGPSKDVTSLVDESLYEKYSDEWWTLVYDGKIAYDPGRVGIWKEYLTDWYSSVKSIFFGKGIKQPEIGRFHTHNLYIKYLWRDGILGILLWCGVLVGMINFKKIKNVKLPIILLLVLPYLCLGLFENEPCLVFAYAIIPVFLSRYGFNETKSEKTVFVTTGILPIPATKGGAVETLTEYLLQSNEKKINEKYEVISIYDQEAKEDSSKYKNTSFEFVYIPKSVSVLDWLAYVFAKKILRKNNSVVYRHLVSRLIYLYKVSAILQKNDYEKIIIENSAPLFLALKWNGNALKYQDRVFYHLHNEVKKGYGCVNIMKNCRQIMCVSNFVKNSVADFLKIDRDSKNLCVVKNCIDKNVFNGKISAEEKNKLLAKYNITSETKIILFTGRLTQEKGIDVLMNALTLCKTKNLKLLIVGGYFFNTKIKSDYINKLEELNIKLADKVVFTGYVNYNELPKYYALADLVVLPSMWDEPAGMTMIESLASGKSLITTASGGIPEYVGNNAILLKRDETIVSKLAIAIDEFFENKMKTKVMIDKNSIMGIEEYCDDFISYIK